MLKPNKETTAFTPGEQDKEREYEIEQWTQMSMLRACTCEIDQKQADDN